MRESDESIGAAIKAASQRVGTPVAQGAELTGLLSRVADAKEIPDRLVVVLAEILSFVSEQEASESNP